MDHVLRYTYKSFEKLPVRIWGNSEECSRHIAQSIALAIRQKQQDGQQLVLGLATGSTPTKVYDILVRMHREDGLSFHNVVTFNLDEYYPMQPDNVHSYVHFMNEYLFDHVDIPREHIHIPDGTISMDHLSEYCAEYEQAIEAAGGIDIQILGIGRTGHIGFNEPGSWETSTTRLVKLDEVTRRDAAKDFYGLDNVPMHAITMGIQSILNARKVYLLAWGEHKAPMIRQTVEGPAVSAIPASFLQMHRDAQVHLDAAAATELTRIKTPWLVGMTNWNDDLVCKAVVWLSQKLDKPILKLTNEDYNENSLSELILEKDSAYAINLDIFNRLQRTITGWPGGKPNADDSHRPERAKPDKKRVIIFSPHPDDDVISMGGTFLRLVEQGHDVHVAYQTSGNIAVHDHDALRYLEFSQDLLDHLDMPSGAFDTEHTEIRQFMASKQVGDADVALLAKIKGWIRKGEATAAARFCGVSDENIHFLNMPFYETGSVRKKEITDADCSIIRSLLDQIRPHQVFAAGDLADPHDTHRKCLNAIIRSMQDLKDAPWMQACWLWLYRGAWHEWSIDEIQMAVPLSPAELLKKRQAIFMHQSQKDRPPFPGDDEREFWQRAEQRNRLLAHHYNALGLAEYEAMEAFRRYEI
ncbi:MAG: glucosamine-6-phosphate deaminase [Saprospiraceae bacterium]|nr:glucosamine-6-phosphate deaminase [Saprospiraceae bacterium]